MVDDQALIHLESMLDIEPSTPIGRAAPSCLSCKEPLEFTEGAGDCPQRVDRRRSCLSDPPPKASTSRRCKDDLMPTPVVTHCPFCGKQHLDVGEWETREHRWHQCVDDPTGPGCSQQWRLPDIEGPTVGVSLPDQAPLATEKRVGERLWLDDMRKPPWGYDRWAKTAAECIQMLQDHYITHVSLDHDLHDEHYGVVESSPGYGEAPTVLDRSSFKEQTGYAVLEWMHEHNRWTQDISVHTLNPRGGDDMMNKLRNRAPGWVKFQRVKPKGVV